MKPSILKNFSISIFYLFLILSLAYNHILVQATSLCEGDEDDCVSQCDNCPSDQTLTGACCNGYYQGQNCNVWSPLATAPLCQGSSSASNPYVSCQDCLECQDRNDCKKISCDYKTDSGTCCYSSSDPNKKPDLFQWMCKGCANCPDGYYSTAYETLYSDCRNCNPDDPNDHKGINCYF